jgi:hypothetical protein
VEEGLAIGVALEDGTATGVADELAAGVAVSSGGKVQAASAIVRIGPSAAHGFPTAT